jgi:hypothetical protein
VKHTVAVTVSNSLAKLEEKTLYQRRRERPRVGTFAVRIDEFLEIRVEIFENQVEIGFVVVAVVVALRGIGVIKIGVGAIGVNVFDGEEADDVERLREHLKERNLAKSGRRNAFFVHFKSCFLEGDYLPCYFVFGFVHFAVCAFAYLLQFLILFHFFSFLLMIRSDPICRGGEGRGGSKT